MQVCPNCGRERDDRDVICVYCGDAATMPGKIASPLTDTPFTPAASVPADVIRNSFASDPTAATARLEHAVSAAMAVEQSVPPAAQTKPVATRATSTHRYVALGAVAIVVVSLVALARRPPQNAAVTGAVGAPAKAAAAQPSQPSAAARLAPSGQAPLQAAAGTAAEAAIPLESIPVEVPKWKLTQRSRWGRDGSATMSYEVEAERDVAVFQDHVRPVLAVRCAARNVDVFVVLQSAATIENASDTHTVKIGLDSEPEIEQQWLDSIDKQALFSPDGHALAAKLGAARRLRFSFRPFNAPPATVEFDVHGFDQPLATMSKACAPAPRRGSQPRR